jgi:hypothetical protein
MSTHKHLFQKEGSTWACFGHDDACGLRAPACFTPLDNAVTRKGLIDLILADRVLFDPDPKETFK